VRLRQSSRDEQVVFQTCWIRKSDKNCKNKPAIVPNFWVLFAPPTSLKHYPWMVS